MRMHVSQITSALVFLSLLAWGVQANEGQNDAQLPGYQKNALIYISWNIFSGRQSPGWSVVDSAKAEYLKTLFSGLEPAAVQKPMGLGESCYTIRNISGTDFPDSVTACKGVIGITRGGNESYYKDSKGLEKFLAQDTPGNAVWDNGKTMTLKEYQKLQNDLNR